MMVVQCYGCSGRSAYVFDESGNANIRMWCRRVKTSEIRSVVPDNDIFAESDMP